MSVKFTVLKMIEVTITNNGDGYRVKVVSPCLFNIPTNRKNRSDDRLTLTKLLPTAFRFLKVEQLSQGSYLFEYEVLEENAKSEKWLIGKSKLAAEIYARCIGSMWDQKAAIMDVDSRPFPNDCSHAIAWLSLHPSKVSQSLLEELIEHYDDENGVNIRDLNKVWPQSAFEIKRDQKRLISKFNRRRALIEVCEACLDGKPKGVKVLIKRHRLV